MSLWTTEGHKLKAHFHPGQREVWRAARRFVFMIAGTQSGKTVLGPAWLHREIQRCGPGDYLAVTSSYDLFKLKMLPEVRRYFELLGIGRYWAGERILELSDNLTPDKFRATRTTDDMWGRIILRSAAAGGGLEAATAKAAWLDEAGQDEFSLESWEAVLRRLSLNQGRVLATTTPYNLGWLKTEIYDAWANGATDLDVIQFASSLNPAFPQEEFDRAQERMQSWRFDMFYRGQFARPAGLIYHNFTDQLLIDSFPIPSSWRRVVGVDFGGANTAVVCLAEDPDSLIWYAYNESLAGGMPTGEHVKLTQDLAGASGELVAVGGSASEVQPRMDWTDAGLRVIQPAVGDVEAGIDRVTRLLREKRIRFFRNLSGLRDELGSYRRKLDTNGEPTDEIIDKRTFHRLDALRYAATHITSGRDFLVNFI